MGTDALQVKLVTGKQKTQPAIAPSDTVLTGKKKRVIHENSIVPSNKVLHYSPASQPAIKDIANQPEINPSVIDTPVFYTYDEVSAPPVIVDMPDINTTSGPLSNPDPALVLIADLYINDQGLVTRVELVSSSFDTAGSDYLLGVLGQIRLQAARKEGAAVDYRMRVSYSPGVLGEVPIRSPEKPRDPLSD
ncbi:hypothetical protein GCM10010970_29090 [Silvimonas iriomotensis]|uniref:Uncharacterized protein n=2 Tax=Silvimonas iriomotensis TaxID=449662 RepID=A0ABQ2PBI9_9NEIS|nr:hypothetical protein GCM10010970_29090 [Silvimonas iriomotensis]